MPSPAAATGKQDAEKITAYLTKTMNERIMVLDGAMGTTIQQYKFTEEDFRGVGTNEKFVNEPASKDRLF